MQENNFLRRSYSAVTMNSAQRWRLAAAGGVGQGATGNLGHYRSVFPDAVLIQLSVVI